MCPFHDFKDFLDKLNKFHKKGNYLFRGASNAKHFLQPGAFRDNEILEYSKKFPHSREIIRQWISRAINDVRNDPNKAFASIPSNVIMRICHLLITTLRYNFSIYETYHEKGFPQNCNDERLINIFKCGAGNHWAKENTFHDYFHQFYQSLVPLFTLDGTLIKKSYVDDEITGLDETYPQHYGFKTAALDWTDDPRIALFFTIYSDTPDNDSKYVSVSIYKEINTEDSPVIIMPKDSLKENPRAVAQKGTFLYFRKPGSFFLANGCFPRLEDYNSQAFANTGKPKTFELEKLVLEKSKKNIQDIQKFLIENQITASSLLLESIP